MKQVAVVIPIYKDLPNEQERASLVQTLRVFGNRDIILLTYKEISHDFYDRLANEHGKNFIYIFFDSSFFKGTSTYNYLLMSINFYKAFSAYKYILICHWDAWVFEDQLDYWCAKNYDIIGAPWFMWDNNKHCFVKELNGTSGNGGFTLRRVGYFIEVLSSNKKVRPFSVLKKEIYWKDPKSILCFLLHLTGWHNTPKYYAELCKNENEDYFWSQKFLNSRFAPVSPTIEDAISFAFEKYPSYLYKLNNNNLPFGCHKYLNNEFDTFWYKYIER